LVTGSPRFQQELISGIKDDKSLDANQLLFVISPSTPQDVYSQIDQIIGISRNLTKPYTILVRPHPYYKRVAKAYFETLRLGENIFLDEQPFLKSLSFSQLVVFTDISTGIFEALMMNKHIYLLTNQSRSKFDIYDFPKIKIADLTHGLNNNLSSIATFDLSDSSKEQVSSMPSKASVFIASYLNGSS
jgi:CDP-glycerol glycerophosphotransferase (TagB/SpsB family)